MVELIPIGGIARMKTTVTAYSAKIHENITLKEGDQVIVIAHHDILLSPISWTKGYVVLDGTGGKTILNPENIEMVESETVLFNA